jgi:sirohydrochlorin cobaltochelatase
MDELPNVFVGTVEGYPAFEDVLLKLKAAQIEEVVLMPFMLVAGEHVHHDLAGSHDDSWKTVLEKEGFEVKIYLHGLGENPAFREIYLHHIEQVS